MSTIDHKTLALSRLATQFTHSTNLRNYIEALLIESNTLEEVYRDIINKRWLDTAEGVQLDIIGKIVGQTREFVDAEIFDYFGFYDHPQAQSFGSTEDPTIGGRFKHDGELITGLRQLTDDEYRIFIKARIIKNSTSSTPEDIINQLHFILDVPIVIFVDGNTFYQISFGRRLNLNEKAILTQTDIIPKTAGVGVGYVAEFDPDDFFGFIGVPGAKGLGTLSDVDTGGTFANLIF